jgi:hypothetical protein
LSKIHSSEENLVPFSTHIAGRALKNISLFFRQTKEISSSKISSSSHGSQNIWQLGIFIHDPKHDGMLTA